MDRPAQPIRVTVSEDPVDPDGLLVFVSDPSSGASVLFMGTVRDHSEGKTDVTHLDYEVYEEKVEPEITAIVMEAMEKWALVAVAVHHRHGVVHLGEASVGVAVSAPHRGDAFEAARYVIDELKQRAPIWKKEFWSGGGEWSRGS